MSRDAAQEGNRTVLLRQRAWLRATLNDAMHVIELHDYQRSSSACRVRITLALKGQRYTDTEIDLVAGAQHEADFRALNPQAMVPVLTDDKIDLSQSLAIIEYLDRCFPEPPLLPRGNVERARAQQFAQLLCCDIQPLISYRVMSFLRTEGNLDANARRRWFRHWLLEGLDALELWLIASGLARTYCVGDQVSIADICLVPQLNIARRNGIDIDDFPRLAAIEENCLKLEAFQQACATLSSARD